MQIFADMLISCFIACQWRSRSLLSPAGFVREVDAALAWAKTDAETTLRRGVFSGSCAKRKFRIYNGSNVAGGLGTLTTISRRSGDHYGNHTALAKSRRTAPDGPISCTLQRQTAVSRSRRQD